ncbi:MAG: sigma-70 family RNA polymerase sigma factor [Planctomycetes bacterium]|nr:sigma-70 family RNA polymerase sigma factor [Planctomycetota bacterium]
MRPPESEDDGILARAWATGDRAAGEALLRRMLPGIYGLCLRIVGNDFDAQDAAQETFARLCREVRAGPELRDVRKWAATVAMNLCFDLRRERLRDLPAEPAVDAPEPLPAADRETLHRAIGELPERYRLVLQYHFMLDLKPRQIAEILGLEDGTARVLLHRAVAALRKKVTP